MATVLRLRVQLPLIYIVSTNLIVNIARGRIYT